MDRPDFVHAAKNSFQQSDVRTPPYSTTGSSLFDRENNSRLINGFLCNPQVEYKYDKEMLKGCVMSVTDDKYTILAKKNAELASDVSALFNMRHLGIDIYG